MNNSKHQHQSTSGHSTAGFAVPERSSTKLFAFRTDAADANAAHVGEGEDAPWLSLSALL